MKYLLFEQSAVEYLASKNEYQSTEFNEGEALCQLILSGGEENRSFFRGGLIYPDKDEDGLMFVGKRREKCFLLVDLTQCDLLVYERESNENLLLVLQKMFRAAIHIWWRQPFTAAERVNHSKLVLFPFSIAGKSNKRLVIEREPKSKRLDKRGIRFPLLAYKYNNENVPYGSNELVDITILEKAGKVYSDEWPKFKAMLDEPFTAETSPSHSRLMEVESFRAPVANGGFRFLKFKDQYGMLTIHQKEVVDFPDNHTPIRIVGPAGTGKTTSMVLRAYRLLADAIKCNEEFRIIYITHSESAKYEIENSFRTIDVDEFFVSDKNPQNIEFISLFSYCKRYIGVSDVQTIDADAADSKEYQLMLIIDAYEYILKNEYKGFKKYISKELKETFESTNKDIIASMLQHEFSVQIKGRANGILENYKSIESLKYGLPISNDADAQDRDLVYAIFSQYERMLKSQSVYDTDDITIEALMSFNAPFWRRERSTRGYDYIFVDEVHLFNTNEQSVFHFLVKEIAKSKDPIASIPICFALDHSQAIGDRGSLGDNCIEKNLPTDAKEFKHGTVFRNSKSIYSLCNTLIASGVLMFQKHFRNPYEGAQSDSSLEDERFSKVPELLMCHDDEDMIVQLGKCIDEVCRDLKCKNYQILIISFDDRFLSGDKIAEIEQRINRSIYYLQGRNIGGLDKTAKESNSVILTSPYNVNGLEFDAVILLGVDGVRVPQSTGVNDVSKNYLRYNAYNMLYLSCSRAKYRLYILGNALNDFSECLRHSIGAQTLIQISGK